MSIRQLLVCLAISLQIAFLGALPGFAYAVAPAVLINEVEMNPGTGPSWVELHNPGASSVELHNASLVTMTDDSMIPHMFDLPDNPVPVLAPGGYYQVFLQGYSESKLATLTLFQRDVILDQVSGLHDVFADDKSWQRFPDGVDNEVFEDWSFKKSTADMHNGDLGQMIAECYMNPLCFSLDKIDHKMHNVKANASSFIVSIFSSSVVPRIELVEEEKKIRLTTLGSGGNDQSGFTHVTFPKLLLDGDLSVILDGNASSFSRIDNGTHSRVIVKYAPGARTIEIVGTSVVPEFHASVIPAAAGIISMLVLYSRMKIYFMIK